MIIKHLSKQFSVPDEMSADFAYWGDMPHWTANEVTALTLGIDPVKVILVGVRVEVSTGPLNPPPEMWQSQLWRVYSRMRIRLQRAVEIGELGSMPWVGGEGELIHPPISRTAWVTWLRQNDITFPSEMEPRQADRKTRDLELQAAAEEIAQKLRNSDRKLVTKRDIANILASSDAWKELTAGRIERVIRVTW